MKQSTYYNVYVRNMSYDYESEVQRFEDEDTARAFAASMANVLDDNGTLFDIDVVRIEGERTAWLTGYSNLPE